MVFPHVSEEGYYGFGLLIQKQYSTKFILISWKYQLSILLKVLEHPELPVGDAGHLAPVCLRVVVEVPGVAIIADLGHDGRLELLVVNLLPVNILEPSGNEMVKT